MDLRFIHFRRMNCIFESSHQHANVVKGTKSILKRSGRLKAFCKKAASKAYAGFKFYPVLYKFNLNNYTKRRGQK